MEFLSAFFFRAHMYTIVPRHVREDMEWMAAHIKTIRNLKREVAALKKQIGKPAVSGKATVDPEVASADKPEGKRARFTSKGITGMRKRLLFASVPVQQTHKLQPIAIDQCPVIRTKPWFSRK